MQAEFNVKCTCTSPISYQKFWSKLFLLFTSLIIGFGCPSSLLLEGFSHILISPRHFSDNVFLFCFLISPVPSAAHCPRAETPQTPTNRLHKHCSPSLGDRLLIAVWLGFCSVEIFMATEKDVFSTASSVIIQAKWNLYNLDSSSVGFGGDESDVLPPAGDSRHQQWKFGVAWKAHRLCRLQISKPPLFLLLFLLQL